MAVTQLNFNTKCKCKQNSGKGTENNTNSNKYTSLKYLYMPSLQFTDINLIKLIYILLSNTTNSLNLTL